MSTKRKTSLEASSSSKRARKESSSEVEEVPPPAASSSIATAKTSRDILITSKSVRASCKLLVSTVSTLDAELYLLRRIQYKHGRQFRSAKWFQSCDVLRRCLEKLVSKDEARTSKSYEFEGQLGKFLITRNAKGITRSQSQTPALALRKGVLRNAMTSFKQVYDSLWNDASEGSVAAKSRKKKAELSQSLDKLMPQSRKASPTNPPSQQKALQACKDTLALCLLLTKLMQSCAACWRMITTHLKTPPSPTFPQLAITLASISASLFSAADHLLLASPSAEYAMTATASASHTPSKVDGLLELYAFLRTLCSGTEPAQSESATLNLYEQVLSRNPIYPECCTSHTLPRKLMLGFAAADQTGEEKGPHSDLKALKAVLRQQGLSMDDPVVIDGSADVSMEEGPAPWRGGKQTLQDGGVITYSPENVHPGDPVPKRVMHGLERTLPTGHLSTQRPKSTAPRSFDTASNAASENHTIADKGAVLYSDDTGRGARATRSGFSVQGDVVVYSTMEDEDTGEPIDSDMGVPIERD